MMRKRRYEPQKCNGGKNVLIWDNETGECLGFTAQIVGRLNLQEDKLNELEEENEQLRKARDESDKFIVKKGLEIEFLNWCVEDV